MSQIFNRSANQIARFSLVGGALAAGLVAWVGLLLLRSDFVTGANANVTQPVQFSHAHHVGGLGIDCRYCHTSVDQARFANIPPTKTCMNCHSQIWTHEQPISSRSARASAPASRWSGTACTTCPTSSISTTRST